MSALNVTGTKLKRVLPAYQRVLAIRQQAREASSADNSEV